MNSMLQNGLGLLLVLILGIKNTGMPTPIRRRTSTSVVNILAPKCNPNPRMIAKTDPRTNPNCMQCNGGSQIGLRVIKKLS